jgi:hypothetical protein
LILLIFSSNFDTAKRFLSSTRYEPVFFWRR